MSDMISGHKYQLAHASDLHLITTLFHRTTFLMVDESLPGQSAMMTVAITEREGGSLFGGGGAIFRGENCRSLSRGAHVRIGGFYIWIPQMLQSYPPLTHHLGCISNRYTTYPYPVEQTSYVHIPNTRFYANT